MDGLLTDQFAFRPTGSTTAALISIHEQVTTLLDTNNYVTIIQLDFSKAFDTVRHSSFARKLLPLDIPDEIFNWFVEFLSERKHMTRYARALSGAAYINASIIQGSGFGPSAYDICASDPPAIHQHNYLDKFADVPSSQRQTVHDELDHLSTWAKTNNLRLKTSKSRELIIYRHKQLVPPPLITGIERVTNMKILGVVVGCDLSARLQISDTLGACSRSLYALRVLRAHGLPSVALQEVARATTQARLLYASPAWWGVAKKEDRNQLESLVKRMRRMGYLPSSTPGVEDLVHAAEERLLGAVVVNTNHILRHLFPPILIRRPGRRPHGFTLPLKDDSNF